MKLPTRSVLTTALASLALLVPMAACDGGDNDEANAAEAAPAKKADDAAEAGADKGDKTADTIAGKPVEGAGDGAVAKKPAGENELEYTLVIEPPAEVPTGSDAMATIKVVPAGDWHINLDFPTSLAMTAPEGVALAKEKLVKADALKLDDTNCEFGVGFTPSTAGEKSFKGKLKFAVCQDEACAPKTADVEFAVLVK